MRWLACAALVIFAYATAVAGDLPDSKKTPGDVDKTLTKEILCAKDFTTSSIRNVTESTHKKVYALYKMDAHKPPCPCEVDHLISLELGGTNEIANLWPQSYTTTPYNAHLKDKLENRLHKLVCNGVITLDAAQTEIRTDWTKAYEKYVGD